MLASIASLLLFELVDHVRGHLHERHEALEERADLLRRGLELTAVQLAMSST